MVDRTVSVRSSPAMPLVVVEDTTRALGRLARLYRDKFTIPILAVAGSNGKTTTREMIAAVLGTRYEVLSTEANLNNQIGVPLTLFRLSEDHEVAVVEIGTNHPGEIARLCAILNPTHGLVTNVGREHLEFFRTVGGVAREEGSLYRFLASRSSGKAFVNADDLHVVRAAAGVRHRVTYGFLTPSCMVRGEAVSLDESACASFRVRPRRARGISVQLATAGAHAAQNALAAAAVGIAFKVSAPNIRRALGEFRPVAKRMEVTQVNGVTIMNDTYNANPDSAVAALQTLAGIRSRGKKVAVLGDMRELGGAAVAEHARVGAELEDLGIEYLFTFGERARHYHDRARVMFAVHFREKNMLAEYLAELLAPGDAVLVKGSRAMKMEDIVTFLSERLSTLPVVPD